MAGRADLGSAGERVAARYLERLGYAIRERNFRCRYGEIDLVAHDGECVVFVEVKTRWGDSPYHPTLSVTAAKRRQLRRLGEYYCAHHLQQPLQPRFDVVAVVLGGAGQPDGERVEHIVNAF